MLQRYKIATQRPYRSNAYAVLYSLLSQSVCLTIVLQLLLLARPPSQQHTAKPPITRVSQSSEAYPTLHRRKNSLQAEAL